METLKLAWKVATFYDLTPHTLARLGRTYGLREGGGLTEEEGGAGVPSPLRSRLARGLLLEPDPRVRACLRHQLTLARRARTLRACGYEAWVRGWVVVLQGGVSSRSAARYGRQRSSM